MASFNHANFTNRRPEDPLRPTPAEKEPALAPTWAGRADREPVYLRET